MEWLGGTFIVQLPLLALAAVRALRTCKVLLHVQTTDMQSFDSRTKHPGFVNYQNLQVLLKFQSSTVQPEF